MAVVYQHKTKDTNQIFYIGIGVVRKRAYSKYGRNSMWHNIVNKHGWYYEILFEDIPRKEAVDVEKYLISYYGRRDLKTGNLANMTGGGDGGVEPSPETLEKMRLSHLGTKKSIETRNKMSIASSRGNHSHAKKVINIKTGEIFKCVKDASDKYGMDYGYLKSNLNRTLVNKTDIRYWNE
jgi:hypothetical protein